MFERETRREKILEARNKEIRLKERTKGILGLGGAGGKGGALTGFALSALKGAKAQAEKDSEAKREDEEDPIAKAEREFFEVVKKVRIRVRLEPHTNNNNAITGNSSSTTV